jgi:hypothetical protein
VACAEFQIILFQIKVMLFISRNSPFPELYKEIGYNGGGWGGRLEEPQILNLSIRTRPELHPMAAVFL